MSLDLHKKIDLLDSIIVTDPIYQEMLLRCGVL